MNIRIYTRVCAYESNHLFNSDRNHQHVGFRYFDEGQA